MSVKSVTAMLACAIGVTTGASATTITQSGYMPLFNGIDSETATISNSVAYIDRIDLTVSGIGFIVTPQSGPLATTAQTTAQFRASTGSQLAINANFFAPCCVAAAEPKSLIGLSVSRGSVVSAPAYGSDDAAASLLLTRSNQASITSFTSVGQTDLSNVYNAVSGNIILSNGVDTSAITPTGAPHDPFGLDPRTDVGVSQDGRYLFLLTIDGRQPGYSAGITTSDAASLLLAVGAYNGLNLDGGGSTALDVANAIGGDVTVNRPSGGAERYDGNNLGVFAQPVPEPWSIGLFGAGLAGLFILRRRSGLVSRPC